jgi:septum formation topological specificity factor MinE
MDDRMEIIGTTNRRYSVPPNALDQLNRTERAIALAAAKVLPEMRNSVSLEYRFDVVQKYVSYENVEKKRKRGEPFRTEAQCRLDRALTDVAAAYDRCEGTIRNGCTSAYDTDSPTVAFREDCEQIRRLVR